MFKTLIRRTAIASAIGLLSLATACSKPADPPKPSASSAVAAPAPTSTTVAAADTQRAPSKLGDLTPFRSIADDVAARVNKNDLPGAKARIKELESAWDEAEAGIKPRAAADWHVLDKAIDHALDALRASSPTQSDCQAKMADLLKAFDTLQGR